MQRRGATKKSRRRVLLTKNHAGILFMQLRDSFYTLIDFGEGPADARLGKVARLSVLLVRDVPTPQTETPQMRPNTKSLYALLFEVAVQKPLKRLAVPRLVASHLVHGVVDGVKTFFLLSLRLAARPHRSLLPRTLRSFRPRHPHRALLLLDFLRRNSLDLFRN